MPDALFVPEGDTYLPTDATLGPWGPQLLHGGPVSALCTTLMEDEGGDGFSTVRFSGDFVRPLAQQPLTFASRVVREGRRLQLVEGELDAAGKLVARCSLLRLRPLPIELPADAVAAALAPPPDLPEHFHRDAGNPSFPGTFFLGTGIELHTRQPGGFRDGEGWFRLLLPVLPGRDEPSPMTRAVAAADFGNGISGFGEWPATIAFPNGDLVVHLARPVEGEWVRLASTSTWTADGIGLATGRLWDHRGQVGVSQQALVLSPAG